MKITVNVQRKNKQGYYIGEDAVPYVDDDIVIVADGLGGMGGFVHKEMDQAFFDQEKGIKAVLSVFPDAEKDGLTAQYARKAFADIFEEKRPRESGYFASRFAVTSMLYAIKEAKIFGVEKFLDPQNESDTQLAGDVADYLSGTMAKLAAAIGLDAKLVGSNQYFLPTTLTMAVIGKRGDGKIDVVTLNAGDSRTYCWGSKGLKALTCDDVDGATNVMNNLVCLSVNFTINIRRFVLDTPCAVFSASDGVHDSMSFQNNVYFEATLCRLISESAGTNRQTQDAEAGQTCDGQETAQSQLPEEDVEKERGGQSQQSAETQTEQSDHTQEPTGDEEQKKADACADHIAEAFFKTYGCHDDSNTIAMALFGFNDFSEFAKTAEKRFDDIRSVHPEWDKYLGYRATLRSMESRINREMLTSLLVNYRDDIARVVSEEMKGNAPAVARVAKKSSIGDFGFRAAEKKVLSLEELVADIMATAYADYTPAELPGGFLSYDEINKKTYDRNVSNYWYKNGARLVCECIAGVGTGKAFRFNMKPMLLPKVMEDIEEVYGQAYKVYHELSDMIEAYDKEYQEYINE